MDQLLDEAPVGQRPASLRHVNSGAVEPRGDGLKIIAGCDLPPDRGQRLTGLVGNEEPLGAIVHAEGARLAATVDALHAQQAAREVRPVVQSVRAHTEVSQC